MWAYSAQYSDQVQRLPTFDFHYRANMDHVSRRRNNEHLLDSVFRVEGKEHREQYLRSRSVGDESRDELCGFLRGHRSSDGYLNSCLSHRSIDGERDGTCSDDDNESGDTDLPIIQKLSISLSSVSNSNPWYAEGCLGEDSRDQEDEMNMRDDERTGVASHDPGQQAITSSNIYARPESFDISLRNPLKRANPIYESDTDAEYQVDNIHNQLIKKRKSSRGFVAATPLYWSEQLPIE